MVESTDEITSSILVISGEEKVICISDCFINMVTTCNPRGHTGIFGEMYPTGRKKEPKSCLITP